MSGKVEILILSAFLVVLIGSGLIFLAYYIPAYFFDRIYGGIILLLGIGVCIGVITMFYSIIKSLLPTKSFYPAITLDLKEHPKLMSFVENLCSELKTDVPDAILLHCEPTFFVLQGKIRTFNSLCKGRILAIGLPLLDYLSTNELRAVLSHEFAHFTGKDTVYSAKIYPAYISAVNVITKLNAHMPDDDSNGNQTIIALPLILPLLRVC